MTINKYATGQNNLPLLTIFLGKTNNNLMRIKPRKKYRLTLKHWTQIIFNLSHLIHFPVNIEKSENITMEVDQEMWISILLRICRKMRKCEFMLFLKCPKVHWYGIVKHDLLHPEDLIKPTSTTKSIFKQSLRSTKAYFQKKANLISYIYHNAYFNFV